MGSIGEKVEVVLLDDPVPKRKGVSYHHSSSKYTSGGSLPIEEGQGREIVGNEGGMEPTAPGSGIMPISIMIIQPMRKDSGLCRLMFTEPDNIQSNARHGEGSQQPERIHVTQDVDLAAHEQQHSNGNACGQSNRPVRRPAEPVALQDKFGEEFHPGEGQKDVIGSNHGGITGER